MKNDLLYLINKIDDVKKHFHISVGNGIPRANIIYDNSEFSVWKQEVQLELQEVYDRTKDKFIWDTLINSKQGFSGWNDETKFNELSGSLYAISKNIDKYYYAEVTAIERIKGEITMPQKSPKIFISHASSDKEYVSKLIDLFEGIGLNEKHIFCSSIAGYGIPLDQDIYDYLKLQFETCNLHVILVLSENYYKSVACMNEMGAAWILKNKCSIILLPGFEFKEIRGAINPRQIGLKLDNDLTDIKEKLGQLKKCLLNEFGLSTISDIRWEQKRDTFISSVTTKRC
ncbi:toll/interleukin-1 receptor domain-containing protein [Clostridium estertheticum]|uniref:toll/interleukin-1 receptor domain-containing protein n=1 Tax=Clostridium estertheticum TaxID=238834 RepID=UPI001C0AE1D9|nr:toll/interleukin-1 receptor domain-containing protein [Clostridium estertheticum]MBU3199497.1 toll/interleukin-1 receptor domain-containing protein [Clostridium estertheticum]WAG65425.1 toll/interleukin-1 receptor domain-containing protein [Clostridium estertheticum]